MRDVRFEFPRATITITVSGKLFVGHLQCLDQLVQSAAECELWPVLCLVDLREVDRAALFYLMNGEDHDFGMVACPSFVQEWIDHERAIRAA